MKRIKILIVLLSILIQTSHAQIVNDGFVTNALSGRYNEDSATAFIQAFNNKLIEVRQMNFTSTDDLSNYLNFNPNTLMSLEALKSLSQSDPNFNLSSGFIQGLIDIKNNVGLEYSSSPQIRSAIKRLSESRTLNNFEATTLAYFDLSLQQLMNLFQNDFAVEKLGDYIGEHNHYSGPNRNGHPSGEILKLPRWLRCAVFVILSGVVGVAGGIVTGAQIGTFIAPGPGSVVGGAIGGVVGGVTGMLGGAIAGCD
jgi:hypothetical protein